MTVPPTNVDTILAGIGVTIIALIVGMALSSFALTSVAAIAAIFLTGYALFGADVGSPDRADAQLK